MTPIGRHRTGRLYPPIAVTLLAAAVAIAACDPNAVLDANAKAGKGSASPGATSTNPTPVPTGLSGDINDSKSPTPGTSGNTSGSPSPTPTASPGPTFSPTPTPPPAVAQYIIMSPTSGLTIHLPPPAGATPLPGMPSIIQLNAEVRLSNGTIDSLAATWTSADEAIATVSQTGLVSAKSKTGTVKITAVSADQLATEFLTITVKSVGDVSVEVE